MTQQSKLATVIEGPILEGDPDNIPRKPSPKSSLLKTLREKKKLSRSEVARRTQLSTYQVEGLEGPSAQNLMERFLICTKALGYKTSDILSVMERGTEPGLLKGTIAKPLFETNFGEGVKLQTYLNQSGHFLGLLQLARGHSVEMKQIHAGDLMLGIVREGVLTVDLLVNLTVHKKDSFFVLPGNFAAKFLNEDGFIRTAAVLLFSAKFPA